MFAMVQIPYYAWWAMGCLLMLFEVEVIIMVGLNLSNVAPTFGEIVQANVGTIFMNICVDLSKTIWYEG